MRIAFYAGACLPIHARTLDERPLGGTETALIRLADCLFQRGHDVTVFTTHTNPPPSSPRYLPEPMVLQSGEFDVMVLVKDWRPAALGAPGRRKFFWTGDGFDQYVNFGLGDPRVARHIDRFLAVSNWQADTLCERSGFPLEKAKVVYNGVYLPYFSGTEQKKRKKLVYSAAPHRGLALLLPIYAELKRRHDDLEVDIFSGMAIYDAAKPYQGRETLEFERLKKQFLSLPACTLHGNVSQRDLARGLMRSAVYVYPNISFETSCISALEAQAAGCPVVASENSAFPETVGDAGILIPGTPGDARYIENFVSAVDSLLCDDLLWERLSKRGKERTKNFYSWEHVADRFEAILRGE